MKDGDGFRVWTWCIEMVCDVFLARFSRDSRYLPHIYIVRSALGLHVLAQAKLGNWQLNACGYLGN